MVDPVNSYTVPSTPPEVTESDTETEDIVDSVPAEEPVNQTNYDDGLGMNIDTYA